jgi:uncharacterized membrane protein YphA (DoxX/SURF4 family)
MYAEHSTLQIVAQVMIAFLFLYRGLDALPRFESHAAKLRERSVPFAGFVLACGLAILVVGGAMVMFDFYAGIAAILLVVFVVMANYCYHHFWAMEPGRNRDNHRNIFCNNIAVTGGLLLLVGRAF